jgi:hypothetical protein
MEASTAQPAEATPAEGQGQEGQSQDGLYNDILAGIPEQYHDTLTEQLKAKDANFTQKFQANSEKWKPYEEMGLQDTDPELVGSWMNLNQLVEQAQTGNPQAVQEVQEWWNSLGEALGFSGEDATEAGEEVASELEMTPEQIQQMIEQGVEKAVSPLQQTMQQQQQEQQLNEAKSQIQEQLSHIREENPGLTDRDEQAILALAFQAGENGSKDALKDGFEEFKEIGSRGEKELFEQKLAQPRPAEGAGMPNVRQPVPTSENVKELATERLKQAALASS